MAFWKKKKEEEAAETPVEEQKLDVDPQSVVPESLSELVIRAIREGVLIVDEYKNIVLANPAAEELTGRTFDEMRGLNYDSILNFLDKTGNRISEMRNPIAKAFTDGSYNEVRDLDLQSSEGRATPVSVIVTPTQGEHPAYVVTLRNIARELEEERERNEFISTASHEMRTPVASIEGYLGLAMNPSTATVDERGMTYLTKAHEASKHLGKLFQDLLDTTKLDDGRIVPHFEPVEIVQLAKKIADEQIPRITAKGLGYQFGSGSVDQQLSGGKRIDQVIYASVDPSFFKEILDNLIENAIKYTQSGWVIVNVRADEHNVQIIVEDTGIGIAREELSHVFQKFYRVDNSDTREIGGTGLGLYLVKQRVEALNGRIWVESEKGHGSRFIFMLPRLSSDAYRQQKFLFDNQSAKKVGK